MKRKLLVLLALVLMLSLFITACGGSEETDVEQPDDAEVVDDVEEEEVTSEPPAEPMGQITIGNTTELTGDWLPYFQNNAADYDIWNMTTGYSTVAVTFDGEYVINETVVDNYEVTENEDGSKTYTWTIVDGLTYDDGTPITAFDYVTSIALWSSGSLGEMGAGNDYGSYLVGWKDFSTGKSNIFSGVRLIDDSTFSVTIDPEFLPYYFELAMVSSSPTKLSFWTDENVELLDDGEGVYFSDNFTAEAYKDKINAARNNVNNPSTGPYVVESYDEASKTAVLKVNENFAGDHTGQKPKIETVIYKKVNQETAMDELSTGAVDLITAMASGTDINAGMDLVDQGGINYTTYPRAGYGKIQFSCDFGPTEDVEVRQALAHLLDRNEFAKSFTGGYGGVVDGPYGESMWFYQESKAEFDEELNKYPYNLDKAIELLESAGWVYDENGNDYTEGIRYKKTDDGELMPLIIEWASTEDNEVSDLLVVQLQENPDLAAAGIKINQTTMAWGELLNWLYRDGSQDNKYTVPTYHMFNLATGFTPWYDRSKDYTIDPDMLAAGYNTNWIIDEELAATSQNMVLADPEDREGFRQGFVEFIERWNYLLPDMPLYSNIYHDFYNEKLQDYQVNANIELVDSILHAYVTE